MYRLLKIVNFLYVTFNLDDNSYKPLKKTNTITTCINVNSNHPTSIIKQIPNAINIRINRLSSSKMISNKHKEIYNEVLHNSRYKNELKYLEIKRHRNKRDDYIEYQRTENININRIYNYIYYYIYYYNRIYYYKYNRYNRKKSNKSRSKKIIWFKPPFSNSQISI